MCAVKWKRGKTFFFIVFFCLCVCVCWCVFHSLLFFCINAYFVSCVDVCLSFCNKTRSKKSIKWKKSLWKIKFTFEKFVYIHKVTTFYIIYILYTRFLSLLFYIPIYVCMSIHKHLNIFNIYVYLCMNRYIQKNIFLQFHPFIYWWLISKYAKSFITTLRMDI